MTDQEFLLKEKVDLHVHLEGTVESSTLSRLADRNGISIHSPTLLGGRKLPPPRFNTDDTPMLGNFEDFIAYYLKVSECISEPEDFLLIADAWGESLASQKIIGVETYFSPTTFLHLGRKLEPLFEGLIEAEELLSNEYGVETRWIFDIVRNASEDGLELLPIIENARKKGVNVTAIGLGGLERGYPPGAFWEPFEEAKKIGLCSLVHAGETAGPESVREAIETLKPDRIGHGVKAIEDDSLLAELAASGIPLEVCPWSNVCLGVFDQETHPIAELVQRGVSVLIASDDPGIFSKNLVDNYDFASDKGLSWEKLKKLSDDAVAVFKS